MTSSPPGPPPQRLPLAVYILTGGTFLMGTSEFVLAGLIHGIADDFGTSVSDAGLTITVFAVGMIIGAPVMALLTLRLPRRLTLTLALAVFALGHVLAVLTTAFEILLLARFITALATGAFWALASVVAAGLVGPAASSRALGVVFGGGMLANVLGVPLGAVVGQFVGWRGAFWGLAILAAIAAVIIFRLIPADARDRGAISIRAEVRALASARLWLTLLTCACITASVLSVYSYVAPLLTDQAGLPESVVPIALLVFGAGALVGTIICGRLGDAHPYRTALVTTALTVAAMIGLLLTAGTAAGVLAFFAVLGLVGLSSNPILVALAARFGGEAGTLATAMPTAIFNLGTAIGTAISAVALDSIGATGPVIVGLGGALLIALPLGLLARRDTRHHSTSPITIGPGTSARQKEDV